MENKKSTGPVVTNKSTKKGDFWDWIWPGLAAFVVVRISGILGGLVTFGLYYWIKPKVGAVLAAAVSVTIGIASAFIAGAMLRQ